MSRARRFADKGNLHSLVLNATDGSASDIGEKILLDGTDTSASNAGFTILLEDATGNADVEVTTYLDNGVFNFTTPPKNENHVMFRVTAPVDTSGIALAHATYVQLTFSQVDYNIGGGWDASTNSFKPPIAGYYQLQAQWHLNSAVDTQQMGIFWRRNESGSSSGDFGDEIARCPYSRHVSSGLTNDDLYASSIDSKIIMYFNGDTDFVNVRAYNASEDSQTANIFVAPYNFWFSGQLVSRSPIGHAGLNAVT
tara:strand:- start:13 stop:771 length:759 start_codon:yes stop_codon:yes gene_type:complete